jgi:predicted DNA-binding transcriptional regulator AlpA
MVAFFLAPELFALLLYVDSVLYAMACSLPRLNLAYIRAVGWLESSIDAWIQTRVELSLKVEA